MQTFRHNLNTDNRIVRNMAKYSYILEGIDLLMVNSKPVKKFPIAITIMDYLLTFTLLSALIYGIYKVLLWLM